MKFLIIVDMQNDFVTGTLKNDNAAKVVPFIKEQLEKARKEDTKIIFTQDTHDPDYMNTLEGKKLPVPHCIVNFESGDKNPWGWEIVDELKPIEYCSFYDYDNLDEVDRIVDWNSTKELRVIKRFFGFDHWSKLIPKNSEVDICGTVSSICVAANSSAIKSIEGVEVNVLTKGCADLSDELQEATFKVLSAQQCNVL